MFTAVTSPALWPVRRGGLGASGGACAQGNGRGARQGQRGKHGNRSAGHRENSTRRCRNGRTTHRPRAGRPSGARRKS